MDSLPIYFAISGAIVLGAMSPGPSFVVVARVAMAQSRAHGVAAALGMGVGGALFAVLALFGLQILLTAVPTLYALLRVAGALYLLFIAYMIWTHAPEPLTMGEEAASASGSLTRSVMFGFATQMSNPKTAIVYASVFSAALAAAPSMSLAIMLVTTVFAIEFIWYTIVAVAFSTGRARTVYLRSKATIDRLAAGAMGLLGAKILTEARFY